MKKEKSILDDPVVREVRQARAKLWREGGGTLEGLMRVVREHTKDLSDKRKPFRNGKR